jgi:hypothetical protein
MNIFNIYTLTILLGVFLIIIYLILHLYGKRTGFFNNPYETVFFIFTYSASLVFGSSAIYYALQIVNDNISVPIAIGGSMMIVHGIQSFYKLP